MDQTTSPAREGLRRVTLLVKEASAAGRLVSAEEAAALLLPEAGPEEARSALFELLPEADGLQLIGKGEGAHLYAGSVMTEAYARIAHLALARDKTVMVAAAVRDQSRRCHRPVAACLFLGPPFSVESETLSQILENLVKDLRFQDIGRVKASDGELYLYSRSYLPPELAASLAEWYSVGQFASP